MPGIGAVVTALTQITVIAQIGGDKFVRMQSVVTFIGLEADLGN